MDLKQLTKWVLLCWAADGMPQGLQDFSWAGYRAGEKPLPTPEVVANVRDFGGAGDGKTNDTAAIRAALARASKRGGAVLLPAGRWMLTDVLRVQADGVVLRGVGARKTVLVCPKSLSEIRGPSPSWSWSGGMVEFSPPRGRSEKVARVVETAEAGSRVLKIAPEGAARPRDGEWLELLWHNDKGKDTLLDHLYGGVIPRGRMGRELQASSSARVREWVHVAEARGHLVTLTQPLRIDVRPEWKPRLVRRPFLQEVGIEGVTFEFPNTTYPGHLKEKGYNAVMMRDVVNGWVRDVRTVYADSGVIVNQSKYVTVRDVLIRGRTMHHPLAVSWSADCLFTQWRIEAPHVHGTTISWAAHGNVFSHGWGQSLAMDAHRAAAFENLHTAITIADPRRPFRSGGSGPRGPHSARRNVYWNIKLLAGKSVKVRITGHREWPLGIFVGFHGDAEVLMAPVAGLRQQIVGLNETPAIQDLHAHQRKLRLRKESSTD